MKALIILSLASVAAIHTTAQTAGELIQMITERFDKVNDYEASGKMKMNVAFIKAPVATVKVYYKKPDKLKINNETGISLVPKGSINISLGNIIAQASDCDLVDAGKEEKSGLRVIKLLPKAENSDVVLSTLYIDENKKLVMKAKTTTKENGTYELEMTYGKYSDFGLADKVVFSFNTKDYKLPKGVTFDYDNGSQKDGPPDKLKNKKGRVEITYTAYSINKGLADDIFK